MGLLFKRFKTKFRYALKPVFAMLVAKRRELSRNEWLRLVEKVRDSVFANPVEYLGNELPEELLLKDVLLEIFLEFMKERAYHDSASAHRV